MIAVALEPRALPLAVAGRGTGAIRRARVLAAGGAAPVPLFTDEANALVGEAGEQIAIRKGLPDKVSLAQLRLLWIAGLGDADAADLAAAARAARVLVNVEDRPQWCDFHSVAEVRRGDLLLTVSTGGKSPGLAARIRASLAASFGPEWAVRIKELGAARQAWRAEGLSIAELSRRTEDEIEHEGWLS